MRFILLAGALALLGSACSSIDVEQIHAVDVADAQPRVLCVVAHPDDEAAFSATLYKISTYLGGACDLFVITNGEAGYKYTTHAETLYGQNLTDPDVGREALPEIRKSELTEAARILRIRDLYMLGETDGGYTQEASDVLGGDAEMWDLDRVREALRWVIGRGDYDFVFVHRPTPRTHGHHQAATILTMAALEAMPFDDRPIPLAAGGAWGYEEGEQPPSELPGYPVTALRADEPPFVFHRDQKFGYQDKVDYGVIVRLAAYSHRSQGSYLMLVGQTDREEFRMFALEAPEDVERTTQLFKRLEEPQFAPVRYDDDTATSAFDRDVLQTTRTRETAPRPQ